jgi:uncharacterized delta-60 repeat protein
LTAITMVYADGPGDLDTTFNGTGILTTSIGSGQDWGHGVAIQPDGKIVVVGRSNYDDFNGKSYFAVARYTITGSLDTTFNHTGIVTTPIGNDAIAISVVSQSDGKIVVAGASEDNVGTYDLAVVRYTITGVLDSTFNNDGIITTGISSIDDGGTSAAIQPDGKIVVAGISINNNGDNDFAVVRYTITGNLDSTFNNTGIVTTPIGSDNDWGTSVAIQPDGKIVVGGRSSNNNNDGFAIVRYTITGALDSTFNNTGIATTSLSSGDDWAYSVVLQPDGKIVAAGSSDYGRNFAVVRYTVTGTLDSTFNHTGIVTTSIDHSGEGAGVALQPNGKIVIGGYSSNNIGNFCFAVARYQSDGTLDTTFNHTGILTTPIGFSAGGDAMAIQSDGKIVVAGTSDEVFADGDDGDFAVARYLGDTPNSEANTSVYLPVVLKDS